ncbi:MAG: Na(+)-translocating NADH-quinone reductase subunit A [Bacteroidales bacterium]|nr:Na(+)-translocating NADH-quinone reductase subunit A [Bacteroidales bacterium]
MSEIIRIKKGLDIKLQGKAEKNLVNVEPSGLYAIKPTDFTGLTPKACVKPEELVKVGSPLFFDKSRPEMKFTSPVSGKVIDISRGEKRKILAIIVESDGKNDSIKFAAGDPSGLSREKIIGVLLESGLWPSFKQRPYNVIADPSQTPKSIFISGFDSAPLAADLNFILKDSEKEFQVGINALKKLTEGKIHLGLPDGEDLCAAFKNATGVERHYFKGPHPAGNVGIQIHHIDPINKGDIVWTITPQNVVSFGRFFTSGHIDNSLTIALTGSEVLKPAYYKITRGASITNLVKDNVNTGDIRYISGNVLTGTRITKDGFIGFYDNQITVIPEGKYYEPFGWALPGLGKFSVSRAFVSWLMPSKQYKLDTNMKGGVRAYVMTGQYEKVFPMDIYPVHLIKAILAENIDKMEQLGIYEVAEEDMALCEFVCTSKIEVQSILRKGLDMMKKEME